ncbi:enoyl-CoA hydratase/isomerase family protein [Streptosporangium amethystogenes subsp. fukuiense]|uniref:Enoyl-CoA hydratase/isomerase family protein n=1 Tax=Streptosporangium amethystogenes subsp. fukuiense TaxID=698418 RepID=A0ABW2T7W9_9ACTN
MSSFEEYRDRFADVAMERHDGILQVSLHTDGGSLKWSERAHRELPEAFRQIATDPDNRVVILTGTGPDFLTEMAFERRNTTPLGWDRIAHEGRNLLFDLLDIEVPVIAAVNGPATEHAELALLSDIVLASETAAFADHQHVVAGVVPGDGVHIVWPWLLGMNRARHFLLTGRTIGAREALELGLVAEVLPPERLLERAWELARQLAGNTTLTLRYTRACLTMLIRRELRFGLAHGLALESLAAVDARSFPPSPPPAPGRP